MQRSWVWIPLKHWKCFFFGGGGLKFAIANWDNTTVMIISPFQLSFALLFHNTVADRFTVRNPVFLATLFLRFLLSFSSNWENNKDLAWRHFQKLEVCQKYSALHYILTLFLVFGNMIFNMFDLHVSLKNTNYFPCTVDCKMIRNKYISHC